MWSLSQIVGALLHPLFPVLLLMGMALWCLWRGRSRAKVAGWMLGAVMLMLFWGWQKPAMYAVRALEGEVAVPVVPAQVHGMLVLGGGTDGKKVAGPDLPVPMGHGAERLTHALVLSRAHPDWHIVFSGGGGNVSQDGVYGVSESELTLQWWRSLGEPLGRVRWEGRSRNTLENERFSAELIGQEKQHTWLLVTSAWHMPRALRIFESRGWKVQPYAVDRRYNPYLGWTDFSLPQGMQLWHMCFREWVGLLSLRWTLQAAAN